MTTARDIITDALALIGVAAEGQDPSAASAEMGLRFLNRMLAQWARKRWLVYHLVDYACIGDGNPGLTVGAGGDFNVQRPDRIESAYVRLVQNTGTAGQADYPLTVIQSHEDYGRLMLKAMPAWPSAVFYDSGFPLGTLYVWPVAQSLYEIHIIVKDSAPLAFAALSTAFALPPEYEEAIVYNLAGRLAAPFGRQLAPEIAPIANAALNTIRQANVQVPLLRMPSGLRGGYGAGAGYGFMSAVSAGGTVMVPDPNAILLEDGSGITGEAGP